MDPATTAALIQGGSSLVGGLLGKDKGPSLRKQRNNMKKIEEDRYKWLVKGAQRAGFNPLTVLRSTGGQMAPQLNFDSPLSARAVLGEAIKTFGGTYAQDAIQRATEDRAQEDWKERYDYQRQNPILSSMPAQTAKAATNDAETGFLTEGQTLRTGGAEYPALDHRVQVRLPSGQNVWMPAQWGERFGIQQGGTLTAGDVTEMVGELTGEVTNTLSFDKILENAFRTGLFFNDEDAGGALDLNPNRNRKRGTGGK